MTLPIRALTTAGVKLPRTALPTQLWPDSDHHTTGLPWLRGELAREAPGALNVHVRLLNAAGIPLVEGRGTVRAGERAFTLTDLRPIGIEAYAHKREAERVEIARRTWSRCALGVLTLSAGA